MIDDLKIEIFQIELNFVILILLLVLFVYIIKLNKENTNLANVETNNGTPQTCVLYVRLIHRLYLN